MTECDDLIVHREGGASVISLNRPKAINAMTLEMSIRIDAALDRFEHDPDVAAIVLEGAGERGLCAPVTTSAVSTGAQAQEYRPALQVFRSADFRESIRAVVIDKDRNPTSSPPRIDNVTPDLIAPYFADLGVDELKFG